jgi:hypothetical protein
MNSGLDGAIKIRIEDKRKWNVGDIWNLKRNSEKTRNILSRRERVLSQISE